MNHQLPPLPYAMDALQPYVSQETLEYHYDNRCVTMVISREMMKQAGAKGEDVEGINTIPRQIDGALLGITIRERKTGGYKISMRGQPPMDCSVLCAQFGGGGHAGAAGCVFDEPLEVVKKRLVEAVGAYFAENKLLGSTWRKEWQYGWHSGHRQTKGIYVL